MVYTFTDNAQKQLILDKLKGFALEKYPEVLLNTAKQNNLYKSQQTDYLSRAETLNQEFSQRYLLTGQDNPMPFFAVNQDLLLFLFTFSYVFLSLAIAAYVARVSESTAKGIFVLPVAGVVYMLFLGFLMQFG